MKQITAMLASTADGAMLVDQDGKVTFWNRSAERLLGCRAAEVVGRPCHAVLRGETLGGHSLCSASCPIRRHVACDGTVRNFDMQTRTKAGRMIWLNVSSFPVPSRKKGRFLAGHLFRDITRQARVLKMANELYSALCVPADGAVHETMLAHRAKTQTATPPQLPMTVPLTKRQREILSLLAEGKGTKGVADRLCIRPVTVRNHIQHILAKLGAHSRVEAIAIAFHRATSSS